MKIFIKTSIIAGTLGASLLLNACGFKPRSPNDVPVKLRSIYLQTSNVSSQITTGVKQLLTALHVSYSDPNAPVILRLANSKQTTDLPVMFNSLVANNYHYQLTINFAIQNKKHQTLLAKTLLVSENVTHNTNQVDIPIFTPLMRHTLDRKIVNEIYNQFISITVRRAVKNITPHKKT